MLRVHALRITLSAALALSLAACSGGDEPEPTEAPAAQAAGSLEVVGDASVQWVDPVLEAEATDGTLDVTLTCEGAVPHNLLIENITGDDGEDLVIAECAGDDSATATVAIQPGGYVFYCSVPGHRAAGMEGALTVS